MVWRLTICAVLFGAAAQAAVGQTKPPSSLQGGGSRQVVAASHTVHWEQMPLADAVDRLERMSNVAVYVDRRIDPTQRVDLSLEDATPDEIAARLASASAAGACKLGE